MYELIRPGHFHVDQKWIVIQISLKFQAQNKSSRKLKQEQENQNSGYVWSGIIIVSFCPSGHLAIDTPKMYFQGWQVPKKIVTSLIQNLYSQIDPA